MSFKRHNMDLAGPGVAYIILVIPTFTALAIAGQGVYKLMRQEEGGNVILGFGITFLVLIAAAYVFFIK